MAKAEYVVLDGKYRKIKKKYVTIDGKHRKIKKEYVVVDGKYRLTWSGSAPAGQVVFTTSQVWTVPEGVESIDVFMVGGGSSGGGGWYGSYSDDAYPQYVGVGGSSGKTRTLVNLAVTEGQQISIVIGAGGVAKTSGYAIAGNTGLYQKSIVGISGSEAVAGGNTSFGIYSVDGGQPNANGAIAPSGGTGGSSLGLNSSGYYNGAIDGSNGLGISGYVGIGQGTTTRAFGELSGTRYAGGGATGSSVYGIYNNYGWVQNMVLGYGYDGAGNGGCHAFKKDDDGYFTGSGQYILPTHATPNTGSGGAGGYAGSWTGSQHFECPGSNGGSGIVIVRWREQ